MPRYTLAIDTGRCNGCHNCYIACRDEHGGNDHAPIAAAQPRSGPAWIRIDTSERGRYPLVAVSHLPITCQQCEDPGCLKAARDGAVIRRPDGIVIIDPVKARGQREIADACPYGVISWNEELKLAQKCTLCAHLLDAGWREPRCVEACPTQALVFGDADDPASAVSAARRSDCAQTLRPETGMKPALVYLRLPGRCVAGEVAYSDRPDEPAAGVRVELSGGARTVSAESDSYGDFEFTGLEPGAEYELRVAAPGYRDRSIPVPSGGEASLGTLVLERP